jgi:two-component sensor histidine kinase
MTSGFLSGSILRGLAVRVLFFLSLALLPIGLIAIVQTRQISDQSQASAELSLLAVTEQASGAERRVLQEAFGAAEALAAFVRLRRNDTAECSGFLKEYKEASGIYGLVGFIPIDGQMTCSTSFEPFDFSTNAGFQNALRRGGRQASARESGAIGGRQVTIVYSPVFEEDELIGFMTISIPSTTFEKIDEPPLAIAPLALMTFNQAGEILTTERALDVAQKEVPADIGLSVFTGKKTHVFWANNQLGQERAYAILPIVPDAVYALSAWHSDTPFLQSGISTRLSAMLPILMWVASLIVAFLALNRLALTHIRKLGRQMRRFAINRTLPRDTMSPSVPTELMNMESAFIEMAESILRDEATLEDSLREKNILLKEVHHRVKNNLQLISSIMNMQIRQSDSEDAKFVLRRLQDRILSLATVHKCLYQNTDLASVDASTLLHEVVNQLLVVGLAPGSNVKVSQHYDPIILNADDAAPLTLLASEAVTNALKYVSHAAKDKGQIGIHLSYDGPDRAQLSITNSTGDVPVDSGTGLGSKLILAFVRQLNGQVEIDEAGGQYHMIVNFPVPPRNKEIHDY